MSIWDICVHMRYGSKSSVGRTRASAPHGDDRRHEDAGTAISQLLDFYDTDYLGQYNPEAAGDCWSLAYSGSRSDAERVEMPPAELSIHATARRAKGSLAFVVLGCVQGRTYPVQNAVAPLV